MIGVELHGKMYQVCSEWEDITLGKFIELSKIPIPEKLEDLWVASSMLNVDGKKEKKKALVEYDKAVEAITMGDMVKFFPAFYGKVLTLLSDIPKEIVSKIHADPRTSFFDDHLKGFVLSLVYSAPVCNYGGRIEIYQPPDITEFEIDGKQYHFPKSLKLYNEFIPMSEEKVVSFAEAADIDLAVRDLRSGGVLRFPIFMGIYCREEGEEYSESRALERAEIFQGIDMPTVWALFIYTVQLTHISQNFIQTYLLRQVAAIGEQTTKVAV